MSEMEQEHWDGLLSSTNPILLANLLEVSEGSKMVSGEEYNDNKSLTELDTVCPWKSGGWSEGRWSLLTVLGDSGMVVSGAIDQQSGISRRDSCYLTLES